MLHAGSVSAAVSKLFLLDDELHGSNLPHLVGGFADRWGRQFGDWDKLG